jgi:hypothetical protein
LLIFGRKSPFAAFLLPNLIPVRGLVYCGSRGVVNDQGRVGLHIRENVAVQVQGGADLRMAKALRGHFGLYARGQQMGGTGVKRIMKPDSGQGAVGEGAGPIPGRGCVVAMVIRRPA